MFTALRSYPSGRRDFVFTWSSLLSALRPVDAWRRQCLKSLAAGTNVSC